MADIGSPAKLTGARKLRRLSIFRTSLFFHNGVRYNLVAGADAMLLVDWETWNAVIGTRKATEGRRVGEK